MRTAFPLSALCLLAGISLSHGMALKACGSDNEPIVQPENTVIACPSAGGPYTILKPPPCPNNGGVNGVCDITPEWCQAHPRCVLQEVSACEAIRANSQVPVTESGLRILREYCRSEPAMCKSKGIDKRIRCLGG